MDFALPPELLQFLLMLGAWVVAFLLGRELHIGFSQWRASRRKR